MPSNFLCLNCFQYKGAYDVCPYCGYMEGTPPEQAFHLHPGEVLGGRYIIGTVLGVGGFGVTYKAWDGTLSSVVAVKEFYPGDLVSRIPGQRNVVVFSGNRVDSYKSQLKRFLDEAQNMAKFNNDPHIVGVYDYFEENHTAYIVMEYLDGQTLKAYMAEQGGKLPEEEALRYAKPILEAVASIHMKKIIHRDISPDNIFILKDGRVKVLDFGAARFSEGSNEFTVVIKPGYAPPEQYRSKMKQGPWTDLYAVGATLYKMLTGVTPDESVDRMEKDVLKPPSKLVSLKNPSLDKIIMKAIALEPELRFKNASSFIDAILGRREVELPEVELKKRKVRRTLSVIASIIAAFALLLTVAFLTSKPDKVAPALDLGTAPDTITVLVDPSEKLMFETLIARYEQEYAGQQVEIITDRLEANPTLFRADEIGDKISAPIDELLDALDQNDYLFLSRYGELFPDRNQLPLTFFVPVCFANTTLVTPPSDYSLIEELEKYQEISGDGKAESFFDDELPYLVSTTQRLRDVQENLPGYYAVLPMGGADTVSNSTLDTWCVNASVDSNKQLAAQLFLGFLLSDYAQNVMCLQNNTGIPINRNVFTQYLDINTDLNYLRN